MNKTVWKIFICFSVLSAVIAVTLLGINFFGFALIGSDTGMVYPNTQKYILEQISENMSVSDSGISLDDARVVPKDSWCILIDENGDIIWSHNKPQDIPSHYSLNDVAKMTKWFLNDYPVYVRAEDYGLIVLGIPKNAVGKYDVQYSMDWFRSLPRRILIVIFINIVLALVLAFLFGEGLYERLKLLTAGIKDLCREKPVNLKEKGIFKEVIENINETSRSIERKNAALAKRDSARLNWIAGISHDIRTPLSLVMGYSQTLAESEGLPEEDRRKALLITAQSMKIKKLIEDLNLISSLEYDMQLSVKKEVKVCPVIRRVVSDILNSGLDSVFEINIDLRDEQAAVDGDESLIERAVFNLINNSISHNPDGCVINISQYSEGEEIYIRISDNGCGVPDEVLQRISVIPKSAHGLGLPMAYRIIRVHGGKMSFENRAGFSVLIELPKKACGSQGE